MDLDRALLFMHMRAHCSPDSFKHIVSVLSSVQRLSPTQHTLSMSFTTFTPAGEAVSLVHIYISSCSQHSCLHFASGIMRILETSEPCLSTHTLVSSDVSTY